MGQTAQQIETDIDRAREDLRSNLAELESRAREAADWRAQFRRHPGPMSVAAVIGGMLLFALIRR